MAEISIIVPVYNAEKYLRDTLNALCAQTFDDLEIILVDDGSTDSSGKICDEYAQKDSRVKSVHKPNGGVCSARNLGVARCSGKYVGFFDSDDMPRKDMYETLVGLMRETDSDIVIGALKVIYDDGTVRPTAKNEDDFISEDKDEILSRFLRGRFGTAVNRILLTSELADGLSFDESIKINEDKLYMFEALCRAKRVCYHDKAVYDYYRRKGSSSCAQFSDKYFDCLTVADRIDGTTARDYPNISNISKAAVAAAHLSVLKLMCLENGAKKYKDQWNKSTEYLRGLDKSFCKKYFKQNDYIKWLSLKLGSPVFKLVTRLFSKN